MRYQGERARASTQQSLFKSLLKTRFAIIGGGRFCKALLIFFSQGQYDGAQPQILGVADVDASAEGLCCARELGLFTTTDFRALYDLEGLEVLLELTPDNFLADVIQRTKPAHVKLIDHIEARVLWSFLQIEKERARSLRRFSGAPDDPAALERLFSDFADRVEAIVEERARRYEKIERDLVDSERATAQVVQGSTIPSFVIDRRHVVTHWNNACEKLTGYPAHEIVGTCNQWKPFRLEKRPIMADLILDGVTEDQVWRYYGTKWRKSALIEGAYEAEEHFPHLGDRGKWLFFSAAPIKAPDGTIVGAIETLQDITEKKEAEENKERHNRLLAKTARDLAESERRTAQIIQGSTIPTFVIDEAHRISHWNRALEKLTGYRAADMVGTRKHSLPFWEHRRPTLADVILDGLDDRQIHRLYDNWWPSALIEGAYEAEAFFPNLGEKGKWCFFTAAPIKGDDGTITGAIETFWDRTEQKKAEQEKERHFNEITGLCSIYTALSTSLDLSFRIKAAMEEIKRFLAADGICIFLLGDDGVFHLRYNYGTSESLCKRNGLAGESSIIYRIAKNNHLTIYDDLPEGDNEEIGLLEKEGLKSLAYIPIGSKEKGVIGVIRLGSRKTHHFSEEDRGILELIGNRIGVAIENAMLHEQYIKSEEKYRSLFNNDPNPIFIIDSRSLEILDTNQRAQDCYGYHRREMYKKPFLSLGDAGDEQLIAGLRRLAPDQSILFSKKRHYRKGGLPFYVNINVSFAKYSENDVLIATTTDITESVEKETQLIQASKMTTLGQMASGIAHEINQPLNVIQVCTDYFLKMIRKGKPIPDADLKELASDISSNIQRATGIIKHMRDFARQSEVVRHKVNINAPIQDVFKVMGHQLKVHQIEVVLDLEPNLPDIMAEHNRLEQVFINLVTNAIDAMDEREQRGPDARWRKLLTITSMVRNGRVIVTVADTGTGMSPEIIDKIFEPFFTTKAVGRGTGLGVSISYGIVKDYGGSIDIDSDIGKGTVFSLTFPALSDGAITPDA